MESLVAIERYRDVSAWQTGMELVTDIYRVTESFPTYEKFGLTTQLRHAAISIVSNIARGHDRSSPREQLQHMSIARASAVDVEVQLLVAERLGYTEAEMLARVRARCDAIRHLLGHRGSSASGRRGRKPKPGNRRRYAA
jgi:four helix bundle protein